MLKIIHGVVTFILFFAAPIVTIKLTLDVSKRTVAIVILSELVIFLCVVINFVRTFHEQTNSEALAEWSRREEILEKLYEVARNGKELVEKCRKVESLSADDKREISGWHRDAAGYLERELGIEYRRRFYEHREAIDNPLEAPHEYANWIETRTTKIRYIIAELKKPLPQLFSPTPETRIQKV